MNIVREFMLLNFAFRLTTEICLLLFVRTVISKRKEEHFEMLSKKVKLEKRAHEGSPFASVVQKSTITQEKVKQSVEEPEGILKETQQTTSWKGHGELSHPEIARYMPVRYLLFSSLFSIY